MIEITKWEYDKLQEYKEEYFKLLEEKENLYKALKPIIKEILEDMGDEIK